MKPNAIVYTSSTGFTRQYAFLLGEQTGLPVYSLEEAKKALPAGETIVYLGWIFASQIKGYGKAAGRYRVCALCGVGLTPTGGRREEVRKASKAPEDIPLFTLQGGMDRGKLRGMNKLAISMLTKGLQGQDQCSPADEEMLALLTRDDCYVSLENLSEVLEWLRTQ